MAQALVDRAFELMKGQGFSEALNLLRQAIDHDPLNWNAWELAGQCCRFLNNIDGAIQCLTHAANLKKDEPAVLLALGIAFQLNNQWDDAIKSFCSAIEIDPDYDLAYNSLALTQKKKGELDKALHNYDAGAKALARRIVKSMRNNRDSPILKTRPTACTLWSQYSLYGATYLVSTTKGIDGIAWPTGEFALEEERTEKHAGLYWIDMRNNKERTDRLFLPNYFNSFRGQLERDAAYSNLIGNRGTVLKLLDRHDEARLHFEEATEFMP